MRKTSLMGGIVLGKTTKKSSSAVDEPAVRQLLTEQDRASTWGLDPTDRMEVHRLQNHLEKLKALIGEAWSEPVKQTELTLSIRLTTDERDLIADAARELGWSPTKLIRTSALERAVHVLNSRRTTSFDFENCADTVATQLFHKRIRYTRKAPDGEKEELSHATLPVEILQAFDGAEVVTEGLALDRKEFEALCEAVRLGGTEFLEKVLRIGRERFRTQRETTAPLDPVDFAR